MASFMSPDGVRLHYELKGDGPPLVLHLGAGGDSDLWRAAGYVGPLSRSNTCILFDHRGHGRSDHPVTVEANHIDRYVDDVIALVDHLDYSSVSFLGWSSAVAIGLKAAQNHPRRFESLVLLGGIARRATPEQIAESTRERLALMREKGWSFLLDDMVAAEKLPVPRWFLDRVAATDVGPWIASTEARPSWRWSPWDAMPEVKASTLLLAGELEDPEDVLAEVASAMPRAARILIPGREHINAFLCSEFVVPRVLEFLGRAVPA